MKGTYLLIDLLTLLPTLIFSFHRSIGFHRLWRNYLPALVIAAAVFLLWDAYFTRLGVWGFNRRYLTGLYIGNLPVEEWLFFGCIPYACVFTLFCREFWGLPGPGVQTEKAITWALVLVLGVVGIWKVKCRYTASTFLSLAVLLLCCRYIWKVSWLGRFYTGWLVLLVPLVLVDGVLTGTGLAQPVVWYHAGDILGVRVGTIPVEDFMYGMELILLNVLLFEGLQRHRRRLAVPLK